MAKATKYDYSKFMIPEGIEHKNGVYLLTDGEYYYVGKAYRDYGFKQRYGTYLHNEAYAVVKCAGDEFLQSNSNVEMHWLYWCEKDEIDKCKSIEDYFIKAFRIIHGDKLLNKDVASSKGDIFETAYEYFKIDHKINLKLLLELDLERPDPHKPLIGSRMIVDIKSSL